MKKHLLSFAILAATFSVALSGCSKDDDDPAPETKTELLMKSTWKFDKAEAAIVGDISSQLEPCVKDNVLTFTASSGTATSGSGTLDEGATKCDNSDPQTSPFTWEIINNGAVLRLSAVLFTGGSTDFNIVTLNATNLVLSQQMSVDPFPATTVTVTLKH